METYEKYLTEGKGSDEQIWASIDGPLKLQLGFMENNINRAKKLLKSKGDVFKILSELKALEGSLKKAQTVIQKAR